MGASDSHLADLDARFQELEKVWGAVEEMPHHYATPAQTGEETRKRLSESRRAKVEQMPWDRENRLAFIDQETLDWYLNHKREPFSGDAYDANNFADDPVADVIDDPEKMRDFMLPFSFMTFDYAEKLHEACEDAAETVRQQLCAEIYYKAIQATEDKSVDIGSGLLKMAQEQEHMLRNRKVLDAESLRKILEAIQKDLRGELDSKGIQAADDKAVDVDSELFNKATQEPDREEIE